MKRQPPALKNTLQRLPVLRHQMSDILLIDLMCNQSTTDRTAPKITGLLTPERPDSKRDPDSILLRPAHHHKPSHHASHTIIPSALDHRIQMRPDQRIPVLVCIRHISIPNLVRNHRSPELPSKPLKDLMHRVLRFRIPQPRHAALRRTSDIIKTLK